MSVSFSKSVRTKVLPINLESPARLRARQVCFLFGISRSTMYVRLARGDFPPPDGKDGRQNYWRTSTIKTALDAPTDQPMALQAGKPPGAVANQGSLGTALDTSHAIADSTLTGVEVT